MAAESFFDFHERIGKVKAQAAAPVQAAVKPPLTVHELTVQIEKAIKSGLPSTVHVRGEISNLSNHRASGHIYFTLRDVLACIDCVMFKSDAARLKFAPADGMEMIAAGRVAVYAQRGRYQLYVSRLDPIGQGAMELAFQQLRAKLEAEGLFSPERKRPLPRFPMCIAMVTSVQTAALQDMLKVLRRFPWLKLKVYHVPVQGDGAAEKIAAAIAHLNSCRERLGVDVLMLARGGGSLEDLWEFNEEAVARAVAGSEIPVITGIGHEVDVSIADLVADYHAHTPTEAAQVVCANWKSAPDAIDVAGTRLRRGLRGNVQEARQRLALIQQHEVFRRPGDRINALRQVVDDHQKSMAAGFLRRVAAIRLRLGTLTARLQERHPRHLIRLDGQRVESIALRLHRAMDQGQQKRAMRLDALGKQLQAVGPQQVLQRGYSITRVKKDLTVVRSAGQLKEGQRLITRLRDGEVESIVQDSNQLPLFE